MRDFLLGLLIAVAVILAIAFPILFVYAIYKLVLWAGAPKYVALISALAIVAISGIGVRIGSK